MDGASFDGVAKTLARTGSRRRVVALVSGALAVAGSTAAPPADAVAARPTCKMRCFDGQVCRRGRCRNGFLQRGERCRPRAELACASGECRCRPNHGIRDPEPICRCR